MAMDKNKLAMEAQERQAQGPAEAGAEASGALSSAHFPYPYPQRFRTMQAAPAKDIRGTRPEEQALQEAAMAVAPSDLSSPIAASFDQDRSLAAPAGSHP